MARHSRHNIGVEARGKTVKTYYDLIAHHGRVSEEEEAERLKKGIRQIQNIVQKRVKRLETYEKKTGITSSALTTLRETGFGKGVSTRGDIDMLRESYQAGIKFLKSNQSTIKGIESSKRSIEESLRKVGWKSKKGLTGKQYQRYQELAKKFYSEESKMIYYLRARGTMDRETLRKTANKEIKKLLRIGNIDKALDMADQRLEKLYIDAMKKNKF